MAVCASEADSRALEEDLAQVRPGVRVMWETHEVLPRGVQPGGDVHIVMLSPSSDVADSGRPYTEELDPIGIMVFAERGDADADAERRRAQESVPHYVVLSLPVGWRRPGWPFTDKDPPPH